LPAPITGACGSGDGSFFKGRLGLIRHLRFTKKNSSISCQQSYASSTAPREPKTSNTHNINPKSGENQCKILQYRDRKKFFFGERLACGSARVGTGTGNEIPIPIHENRGRKRLHANFLAQPLIPIHAFKRALSQRITNTQNIGRRIRGWERIFWHGGAGPDHIKKTNPWAERRNFQPGPDGSNDTKF
jgi:hypothetical protein